MKAAAILRAPGAPEHSAGSTPITSAKRRQSRLELRQAARNASGRLDGVSECFRGFAGIQVPVPAPGILDKRAPGMEGCFDRREFDVVRAQAKENYILACMFVPLHCETLDDGTAERESERERERARDSERQREREAKENRR